MSFRSWGFSLTGQHIVGTRYAKNHSWASARAGLGEIGLVVARDPDLCWRREPAFFGGTPAPWCGAVRGNSRVSYFASIFLTAGMIASAQIS